MPSRTFWNTFSRILVVAAILAQLAFLATVLCASAGYHPFQSARQHQQSGQADRYESLSSDERPGFNLLSLKHVLHHGAGHPGPRARRLDISPHRIAQADATSNFGPFLIKTSPIRIDKPAVRYYDSQLPISAWTSEDVQGPDVEDKDTVVNFANMSEDAYKPGRDDPEWLDVGEEWNTSIPFGWEDSGVRGHVFSDATNSTIILSLKGTTVAMFEGNGTSGNDKDNDNLYGSCCCGQGGPYLWRQVCDCQTGTYTCDEKCVKDELRQPNKYYTATVELYQEVLKLYPNSTIIATGHSLGGVLASLVGLDHGIPSVTFEAYPQALAAKRLGLPTAAEMSPLRRNTGGFHFGHTADPVYMGTCSGSTSFCSIAGYAFETLCHTGKRCVYDVVKDWGWRQSTQTHRLRYAIENVYRKYDQAAPCQDEDVDCVDCYLWKFENGTHTKPGTTTTSSTTSTRTRTETCKTPGWWGCRDETTTMPTTTTTTTTTSTCKTPGWFGCKDETITTTTTTSSEATTTTCTSKGWFGRCLDSMPATTTPAEAAYPYWRAAPTATQTPS